LQGYLRTKLLWNAKLSQRELAQALVVAQTLAPIDLYETLVESIQHAFVFNFSQSLGDAIGHTLSLLRDIPDSRLSQLALISGQRLEKLPPHRPYAASDRAVSTSATNVLSACIRELAEQPRAFRTVLLAAAQLNQVREVPDVEPPGHWRQVIRRLATVLAFNDSYTATSLDLERYLRNHSYSPTLRACCFAVKATLAEDAGLALAYRRVAALNNPFADADDFDVYPPDVRTAIVNDLASRGPLPLIISAWLAVSDNAAMPPGVLEHYAVFLKSQRARSLSLVDELRDYDRQCSVLAHRGLQVLVRRAFLGALIESGMIGEALKVAMTSQFSMQVPTALLPLTTLFPMLRWKELRANASDVALPIVLHVTWQLTGSDLVASNLRTATNAFCVAHGITSIEQLKVHLATTPTEHAVYFLRNVCVSEILDMCSFVGSSRAASECRREVCVILSDMDPDNRPVYSGETFAITRALSVQE